MPKPNDRISEALIELASTVTGGINVPTTVRPVLEQLDAAGWTVAATIDIPPNGTRIILQNTAAAEVAVTLPGFGAATVLVSAPTVEGQCVLDVVRSPETDTRLELRNITLTFRFDTVLDALDGATHADATFQGTITVDKEWTIGLSGEGVDLSGRLAGTEIEVTVSGLMAVLANAQVPTGLPADFRGFFAESGVIRLLQAARFNGTAGVALQMSNIALGPHGLDTPDINITWNADAAAINSADMVGDLVDPSVRLALRSIQGAIRRNLPEALSVSCYVQEPVAESVLEGDIKWRKGAASPAWEVVATLSAGSVAVGPAQWAEAHFEGTIAPGAVTLTGEVTGFTLNPKPLALDLEKAALELTCTTADQALRIMLTDGTLGPLPKAKSSAIIIRRATGKVTAEFELQWESTKIEVPTGQSVSCERLVLSGALDTAVISATGEVTGLKIDMPPLLVNVATATVKFTRTAGTTSVDEFSISVGDVPLGCFGQVRTADLVIRGQEMSGFTVQGVSLAGKTVWDSVVALWHVPNNLPFQLPTNVPANLSLMWSAAPSTALRLSVDAALPAADSWRPIAGWDWPSISNARVRLLAECNSPDLFPSSSVPGSLNGNLEVVFSVDNLPQLLGMGAFITLDKTTPLRMAFRVELGRKIDTANGQFFLDDTNPTPALQAKVNFPGSLGQSKPSMTVDLTEFALQADDTGADATLRGRFTLAPLPIPGIPAIAELFTGVGTRGGTATIGLRLTGDPDTRSATSATIECLFAEDATVSLGGANVRLEAVKAEIDFQHSERSHLDVSIVPGAALSLSLPGGFNMDTFGTLEHATFGLDAQGSPGLTCAATWNDAKIPLGSAAIQCERLELHATAAVDAFTASGTITRPSISIGTSEVALESASVNLIWDGKLKHVDFEGRTSFDSVHQLFSLPEKFPYPIDGAVFVDLKFECDRIDDTKFKIDVTVTTEAENFRELPLIPETCQPDVRRAKLSLTASVTLTPGGEPEVGAAIVSAGLTLDVAGFPVRLPGPAAEFITVRRPAGVADDILQVNVTGELAYFSKEGAKSTGGALTLSIGEGVWIDINLPGLGQPEPPISFTLPTLTLGVANIKTSGGTHQGFTLTAEGQFTLRPIHPPAGIPISPHLERFLDTVSDVSGVGSLTLAMVDSEAHLLLDCGLAEAGISVDLMGLLESISRGTAANAVRSTENVLSDTTARFALKAIQLKVDTPTSAQSQEVASVTLVVAFGFGPMPDAELEVRLSDRSFSLELGGAEGREKALVEIPLVLPRCPLSPADLEALKEDPNASEATNTERWTSKLAQLAQDVADVQQAVDETTALVKEKQDALRDLPLTQERPEDTRRKDTRRELSEARDALQLKQADLFTARVRHGFIELMKQVRDKLLTTDGKSIYFEWCKLLAQAMDSSSDLPLFKLNEVDQPVKCDLMFDKVGLMVPFSDLRNTRVTGAAHLQFLPGHILEPLNGVALALGLSADRIFVQGEIRADEEGGGIKIPAWGRYEEGEILPSNLAVGFGYTKRSLAIDAYGGLKLPPTLIDDADTSRKIGFGIRLPRKSQASFKLDVLILPHPIYAVPLFVFNVDLRADFSPGLADTRTVTPFWDGLELIIPNVIHIGFKQFSFTPFYISLVAPNFEFDGDLDIGTPSNGLTLVVDNLWAMICAFALPYVPVRIPMLIGLDSPFFDNLGVNVRLAGFGINFNVQRPLPSMSPLAMLELMGLMSEPTMEIDPNGDLANIVRLTIQDAYISLPEPLWKLFPDAEKVLRHPRTVNINAATFLAVLGQVIELIKKVVDDVSKKREDSETAFKAAIDELKKHPPTPPVADLLAALPADLRRIKLGASFAGFQADAVIALIEPGQAGAEFQRRDDPSNAPVPAAINPSETARLTMKSFLGFEPRYKGGTPPWGGAVGNMSVFADKAFDGFTTADLNAAWTPGKLTLEGTLSAGGASSTASPRATVRESPTSNLGLITSQPQKSIAISKLETARGVVVAARVTLATRQQFQFIGVIYEDGRFTLASRADLASGPDLHVAGIDVKLPLAVEGRLALRGRVRRDGMEGSVKAKVSTRWTPIVGLASFDVDGAANAGLSLELFSDGRFSVGGNVDVALFGGATEVSGRIDITHERCRLSHGRLTYAAGEVVAFGLDNCEGQLGPGRHFEFGGAAWLRVLGFDLMDVRGRVSERGADVEASVSLDGTRLNAPGVTIDGTVRGHIDLGSRKEPVFWLEGTGVLEIESIGLRVDGKLELGTRDGELVVAVEGDLMWPAFRVPDMGAADHTWTNGRIEVRSTGVRVSGFVGFGVTMDPLPDTVAVLSPSISASAAVALTLRFGEVVSCEGRLGIRGVLGLKVEKDDPRILEGDDSQILPVASCSLDQTISSGPMRLMNFRGFGIMSLEDLRDLLERLDPTFSTSDIPRVRGVNPGRLPTLKWENGQEPSLVRKPDDDTAITKIPAYTFTRGRFPTWNVPGELPKWERDEKHDITIMIPAYKVDAGRLPTLDWKDGQKPSLVIDSANPIKIPTGIMFAATLEELKALATSSGLSGFRIDLVWDPNGYFRIELVEGPILE